MTMRKWLDGLRRMVGDPGVIPDDVCTTVPDDAQAPPVAPAAPTPPAAPTATGATTHSLGSHACSAVLLNGIACPVEVSVWDQSLVDVTFEGSDRRKGELRVRGRGHGSVLSISDESPGSGISVSNVHVGNGMRQVVVGNMSVSADAGSSISLSSNGHSIQVSGGRIKVDGVDVTPNAGGKAVPTEPPARLLLRVPVGMSLSLEDMRADVTVGDTEGSLSVYCAGSSKVSAGKVSDLEVTIAGSGRVDTAIATGTVQAHISGSGRVRCRGGTAKKLHADITGSGSVRYDGTAEVADLSVTGSGEIDVFRVVKRLRRRRTGSGRITVGSTAPDVENL